MAKTFNKEIITPEITHIPRIWTDSILNTVTPARLASILRDANNGDSFDFLTLVEEMEESDPHYASVLRTRRAAISKIPHNVESPTDDSLDKKITDDIATLISNPEYVDMVDNLLDAISKGFSVCEIIWKWDKSRWRPIKYIWRDPRYFQFHPENLTELRIRDGSYLGIEIPDNKLIIHIPKLKNGIPIRGGLARLAAFSFICKKFTLQNWLRFIEVFGMPLRIGRYPSGAKQEQKDILYRAVRDIAFDAAAILPESMKIEFEELSNTNSGDNIFLVLAEYLDSQISKAILGQTMTTDNGSSLAQAKIHNEVRLDILQQDARQLQTTINRDLIIPYIQLNYGVRNLYPKVSIKIEEPEDLTALVESLTKLIPLGLKVEESVIRDKFNLPEPDKKSILLGATAPPTKSLNRSEIKPSIVDPIINTLKEDNDPIIDGWLNTIQNKLSNSLSLDEFRAYLETSAYKELNQDNLTSSLNNGLIASNLLGQNEVKNER